MELPARIAQMGIPPLEQPPFVECTCLFFSLHIFCVVHVDLNYCKRLRHVHVCACTCLCMYRINFIWCEAMLLVVNIVTCPIGTDCGESAPVVGVYRQPRLAEGVLPTGNYCTRVAKHGSAILNVT